MYELFSTCSYGSLEQDPTVIDGGKKFFLILSFVLGMVVLKQFGETQL